MGKHRRHLESRNVGPMTDGQELSPNEMELLSNGESINGGFPLLWLMEGKINTSQVDDSTCKYMYM